MKALISTGLAGLLILSAWADSPSPLFDVEDFKSLPPDVKVLSETVEEGVIVRELTFAGAPFNGDPTRIYAFFVIPAGPGKFPGVLQIHGAGLGVLPKKHALFYAKNGFACLSMDWAGPATDRKKPRTPPFSEFISPGSMAKKQADNRFSIHGVEVDTITNGVRFALRSLEFLRNQPEVDPENLFVSGTSAGAHLTLLLLGHDESIRGASVKYGSAFIRDMPGYFGGYFGPLSLSPPAEQDAWLASLDPKHRLSSIRSNVLMLSGTDDIFFWMPVVLKTYRELPPPKHLIMTPNDNHTLTGDETMPMRYFQSVLGLAPPFPTAQTPMLAEEKGESTLQTQITSEATVAAVSFVVKRMPLSQFRWKEAPPWDVIPAVSNGEAWVATIPALEPGEQLVAYAQVEDTLGRLESSDTREVPEFPKWRGLKQNVVQE